MHISEGVLTGPVLLSSAALAAIGTTIGLKKMDQDRIVSAGILSAAFFIAALIHIPIGPSSVHLILNGIVGLLLGWVAFPVILTALVLQAIMFQYGGITTLGINSLIMATPAVSVHFLFRRLIWKTRFIGWLAAFACGSLAVIGGAVMVGAALVFAQESFTEIAVLLVSVNLPIMLIEGIITAFCIEFLKKVHPVLLPGYVPQAAGQRTENTILR